MDRPHPPGAAAARLRGVPLAALLAGALLGRAWAAGDDPAQAPHPEVRAQILSEFRFVPAPPPGEALPPVFARAAVIPAAGAPQGASADVVAMQPYTVRETTTMALLHSDIALEHATAVTAAEMRILGVGLHEVRVGPLHFFAATAFYIPFAAGVTVTW